MIKSAHGLHPITSRPSSYQLELASEHSSDTSTLSTVLYLLEFCSSWVQKSHSLSSYLTLSVISFKFVICILTAPEHWVGVKLQYTEQSVQVVVLVTCTCPKWSNNVSRYYCQWGNIIIRDATMLHKSCHIINTPSVWWQDHLDIAHLKSCCENLFKNIFKLDCFWYQNASYGKIKETLSKVAAVVIFCLNTNVWG